MSHKKSPGKTYHLWIFSLYTAQLPGRLFSPSDKCKKLPHHFLLHFSIGMGSYNCPAKYRGVFQRTLGPLFEFISIFFIQRADPY